MFTEERIGTGLRVLIYGLEAPPVPLKAIFAKIAAPQRRPRISQYSWRFAVALAAVVAMIFAAFPSTSVAVMQTIEARYRAALEAMGGSAPPPVPTAVLSSLPSLPATLASAQSRVPFTIVAPSGLPKDVVSTSIRTIGTGIYSKRTHSWRAGSADVTFAYRRTDGRSFELIADVYDPQAELPPKYMFEAMDPALNGRPVLIRHEHFAWRNGNQVMLATEGTGITKDEILAIQRAMRGIALPRRDLHAPASGRSTKMYILKKP